MTKYSNKKSGKYDSRAEARRGSELALLARAGIIHSLEEQKRFELIPKQDGERPVHYIADFVYRDSSGELVCEDVKGMRTKDYIIKRKLMLHVHGIRVIEIALQSARKVSGQM